MLETVVVNIRYYGLICIGITSSTPENFLTYQMTGGYLLKEKRWGEDILGTYKITVNSIPLPNLL